jgi:hypothetical protein
MLSKALKLFFPCKVEIVASTLQPPSTVHTFTFSLLTPSDRELGLPSTLAGNGGVAAGRSDCDVRSSVYSVGGIGRGGGHHGPGGMRMGMANAGRQLRTSNPDQPGATTPWSRTDGETENDLEGEGETDTGGISESDWEAVE